MCGRYALTLPPQAMARLFKTLNQLDYPPRYNIAPTQPIVVLWEAEGRREAKLARWGFVPTWVKDPRPFPLLINARAETMAEKPAFRNALRNTRCVVPADGYFEWRAAPDGTRQPFYVRMADGSPLALAGLHSTWCGPNGEEVDTVAIVTTAASPDLAGIHERMPALLEVGEVDDWLDTRHVDSAAALPLARPSAKGRLAFHAVSSRVNSARNEGADLIEAAPEALAKTQRKPLKTKVNASGQLDLF